METFFNILEVLGSKPKDFFSEQQYEQRIHYPKSEQTIYDEYDDGYMINWLVPDSNEFDMEPVIITIEPGKKYKSFCRACQIVLSMSCKARRVFILEEKIIMQNAANHSTLRRMNPINYLIGQTKRHVC